MPRKTHNDPMRYPGIDKITPGTHILIRSRRSFQLAQVIVESIRNNFIGAKIGRQKGYFSKKTGLGYGLCNWDIVAIGENEIRRYRKTHKTHDPAGDSKSLLAERDRFNPSFPKLVAIAKILAGRIRYHVRIGQFDVALEIVQDAKNDWDSHVALIKSAVMTNGVNTPISALDLPVDLCNKLERHGVNTIYKLLQMSESDIRQRIWRVDNDGLRIIADTLQYHGFNHALSHLCTFPPENEQELTEDELDEMAVRRIALPTPGHRAMTLCA